MEILVVGTNQDDELIFDKLQFINQTKALNLALSFHALPKLSNKFILSLSGECDDKTIIAIIKNTPTLIKIDNGDIVKSYLNWPSLTKRIVTAGRKSELILQACKLNAGMSAIDGTAGFGHDGLILASTGASVAMIEQNPLVALLLFYEYDVMNAHVNWQKLLGRISIHHGDFLDFSFLQNLPKVDLVYLDPMFPSASYSAKVNKNMQLLHGLVVAPSIDDEQNFLSFAKSRLNDDGKVVVKRPVFAPHLSNQYPAQSVANDAIRFDKYDK